MTVAGGSKGNTGTTAATAAAGGGVGGVGSVYVHYVDFDRRLDEWVGMERVDLAAGQQRSVAAHNGDKRRVTTRMKRECSAWEGRREGGKEGGGEGVKHGAALCGGVLCFVCFC